MDSGPPPTSSASASAWSGKRKHVRFGIPSRAQVSISRFLGFKKTLEGRVVDISEGGASVMLTEEVAKGARVHIRIDVKEVKDLLEADGTIASVAPPLPGVKDPTWITGVKFDELPREDEMKIAGWRSYFGSTMIRKKDDDRRRDLGMPT